MIKIKIKSKIIKVPSSFEELAINQVQAIYAILGKATSTKELDLFRQRAIMRVLFDKDRELVQYIQDKSITAFFNRFDILSIEDGIVTDIFKVGRHRYTIIDLNDLTVKEYNDLDRLLINTKTPFQFADEIAKIVIRRVKGGLFLNYPTRKAYKQGIHYGKKKLTKIDTKEFERIKNYIPFTRYLAIFCKVAEFKFNMYKTYNLLDDESEEPIEDKRVFSRVKDKRPEIYGNYHTLLSICDTPTDLFKWEQQNVHDYFDYLGYLKLSQKVESAKNSVTKKSINN